jgi:transcriptional regulator with XRE-family HTH domain
VGNLGKNLRAARERLGLTQEQVAERSGVQAGEVSRNEHGKRDPQASTIENSLPPSSYRLVDCLTEERSHSFGQRRVSLPKPIRIVPETPALHGGVLSRFWL